MKRTTIIALLVMVIMFPCLAQSAPVGQFTQIEGRVDITSPGAAARTANAGDPVEIGEIVRTKSESKAEITFSDGNILSLASSTRVEITEYLVGEEETKGSLKLFRGKTRNVVKGAAGRLFGRFKKNRFEVRTDTAVVGIRGTDFFTYYQGGVTGAVFKDGEGYGYNVNIPDFMKYIQAGQAMLVLSGDQPPMIRPATDTEIQKHIEDTTPWTKVIAWAGKKGEDGSVTRTGTEAIQTMGTQHPVGGAMGSVTITPGNNPVIPFTEYNPNSVAPPSGPEPGPEYPPPPSILPVDGTFSADSLQADFSGSIPGVTLVTGTYSTTPTPAWIGSTRGTLGDGEFIGYVGGTWLSWDAILQSLYLDDRGGAGYLLGDFAGTDTPGQGTAGIFNGSGSMSTTQMATGLDIAPDDLADNISRGDGAYAALAGDGSFKDGGTLALTGSQSASASITGQDWGIWQSRFDGTYSGSTSDDWALHLSSQQANMTGWLEVVGTQWFADKIAAQTAGAWVDLDQAMTGVSGGELIGTFDPDTTTWQAANIGAWVETSKFLQLAATDSGRTALESVNIPCVEIGRANLTGSDGDLAVNMNDVTFFAYSTGATPRIWATSDVNGTFATTPVSGQSVQLTGGTGNTSLNSNFSVNQWNNNQWGASVDGSGTVSAHSIDFNGGAAGTYNANSFSGTGAGVSKSQ